MKKASVLLGFALSYFIVAAFMQLPTEADLSYPKDFRSWKHVKTTLVDKPGTANEKYNGFHHIYANDRALEGYRSGKFPDGSVLVFEVVEMQKKDDVVHEGGKKFADVMFKNAKLFANTGGWQYKEFMTGNENADALKDAERVSCYHCHTSKKEQDYIFSKLR